MLRVISILMALGAALGGLDRIAGNRFGLGKAFEEGFQLLGPVALSMAGMICLAPALARGLGVVITPLYHAIGQDPGMFGAILAIDMGGYQMAAGLADSEAVGRFSGIIAAAILGCTVTYTIPTGMGLLSGSRRDAFARGILCGLAAMPAALIPGALLCGFSLLDSLWLVWPVLLFSMGLMLCIARWPDRTLAAFGGFAWLLRALATLGLTLGAVESLSGFRLFPDLTPLPESMAVVASICVALLGTLPLAELLKRLLRRPLAALGRRCGVGEDGMLGLLICYLSVTPCLAAMQRMKLRAVSMNAAFSVCGASCLAAHLAFTLSTEPDLALPLLLTKLAGGAAGAVLALCTLGRNHAQTDPISEALPPAGDPGPGLQAD